MGSLATRRLPSRISAALARNRLSVLSTTPSTGTWGKAASVAVAEVRATADKVITAKEELRHEARGKSGLLADHPDTKEIRAVLKSMSQKDRDHAILTHRRSATTP